MLVERVEGFAKKKAWKRAYREINEFERALVDDGVVLVKVFLAITKDEQKRRFEERENDPYKRWKIGPEDWRNREHWDEYVEAAEQMFDETSTPYGALEGHRRQPQVARAPRGAAARPGAPRRRHQGRRRARALRLQRRLLA